MVDWKERYMREVEGLNNEGDPIGGDPPSGLRHQVEVLKAENEAQAKLIVLLEYDVKHLEYDVKHLKDDVKHLKDALRAYGDEDIDDDED